MWLPEVIHEDTGQREITRLVSLWENICLLKRESNFTKSLMKTVDEPKISKGIEKEGINCTNQFFDIAKFHKESKTT